MKRLHIVGCPRSGTTLMMELMATCFECDSYCEHEMSVFEEPAGRPRLFFSKQPNDIRYIRRVFLADNNLFVIHMQRDPRAVIASEHQSQPGIYFCNFLVWHACYRAASRLSGHERFLLVRYEDLTVAPDAVQARIQKRFPFLQKKHAFSRYQDHARPSADASMAMSGLRPVSTSRQRNWESHLPRIKAQLQRHPELGRVLVDCGYESDLSWTRMLHAVEAKDFSCRYPTTPQPWKKMETHIRKFFQSRAYLARHGLRS